jgi:hypothetical protein
VIVALVTAALVRGWLGGSEVHLPDAIGSRTRIQDTTAQSFEDQMADLGDQEDVEMQGAVYGKGGSPDLFLVLVPGTAAEGTDELFGYFVDGIGSAGVTVHEDRTTTGTHGDAEYRCIPLSAQGVSAAACMWREDGSVGMTLDLTADGDGSTSMAQAYDAAHA